MKLPVWLCKRFHCPAYWTGRTGHNVKVERKHFKPAFWCSKCHIFRYITYLWCATTCQAYMKPKHEHITPRSGALALMSYCSTCQADMPVDHECIA